MEVRAGEEVEVTSDEDGFRGAWFSARVVKRKRVQRGSARENVLVEYRDLRSDKDESKALRETVELRHVRPVPPPPTATHHNYALYEEVDAYDNDGWWVGVVTKLLANLDYLVYFMQTKEEIQFHHSQLRPHFDFIGDKWVQASKALLGVLSLEEDVDLDNDNGTIIPYIFFQNTGTSKLPNPASSVDKRVEDNISKPVRRSVRCTMTKRKQGIEGNLDNISPTNMKKVREEIVDLETPELSPQQNGKQESHQLSALPSFDGVNGTLLRAHHKAINYHTSFLREKTEGLLEPKNTQRNSVSHLNDVSTCKRINEDTHGTGATNLETENNLIGMKGKLKSCLKSRSSLCSSEATNTTVLETHNDEGSPNLNGVNVEPHIVSHDNISTRSLKRKKPNQNNMLIETYNAKGDGVIEMETRKSCIPSGSPGRGEKIFTITIPHLEYAGQSKADEGNSGSIHGTASLRELKLLAYHSVLQALYLQGAHDWKHEFLLTDLREALNVSNEEHSAELRRVTTANYD